MVMQTISQLGIEVEMRNIDEDTDYRDELVAARDRATGQSAIGQKRTFSLLFI
jgi:hypothetical protein